jgi:hypothetical protein
MLTLDALTTLSDGDGDLDWIMNVDILLQFVMTDEELLGLFKLCRLSSVFVVKVVTIGSILEIFTNCTLKFYFVILPILRVYFFDFLFCLSSSEPWFFFKYIETEVSLNTYCVSTSDTFDELQLMKNLNKLIPSFI